MRPLRSLLVLATVALAPPLASAQYGYLGHDDLLPTMGGMGAVTSAYDGTTGNLWISSNPFGLELVTQIDAQTGAYVSDFQANILNFSALALDPTSGNLLVIKSLAAPRMEHYSQGGQLLHVVPNPPKARAATFDPAGNLYILPAGLPSGAPEQVQRVDPMTGAVLSTHVFPGLPPGSGISYNHLAFDPLTGFITILRFPSGILYEVDLQTDTVVSYSASISALYGGADWTACHSYSPSGQELFVVSGYYKSVAVAHRLSRLSRSLEATTEYCSGDDLLGLCPCGNDAVHNGNFHWGCLNSSQGATSLYPLGQAIVGADTLKLHVFGSTPSAFGLLFGGTQAVAPTPIGDGLRCVGGSLERLELILVDGTGNTVTSSPISLAGSGVSSGDWRYYQWWYRDVNGPCGGGFNTSNAVSLRWQ